MALACCTTFEVVKGGRLTLARGFSHFKVSNIHDDRQGSSTLSRRTTVEMSDRRESASYFAAREVLAR